MKVIIQRVRTEQAEVEMPDGRTFFFEDVLKAVGEQNPEWQETDFNVTIKKPDSPASN